VVFVAALLAATPALAQEAGRGFGGECTLAGTWIGGSDAAKYQATYVPITPWRYFVDAQATYLPTATGNAVSTSWTGDAVRTPRDGWRIRLVQVSSVTGALFPDTADLTVGAVEGVAELDGCDTLTVTYDFFEIYFWDSIYTGPEPKVLFVDQGDVPAPPVPIVEVFHRVPTS
jgi:hypothetical protein